MADDRYNRWQGRAIAQLTVAVALISSFSVAALGFGLSLLKDANFIPPPGCLKRCFAIGLLFLLAAAISSSAAVVTRLLDFRLTTRKVRKDEHAAYNKPLVLFGSNAEQFGAATWRLFWTSCIFFLLGLGLLGAVVGGSYSAKLW